MFSEEKIVNLQKQMESARQNFNNIWRTVAQLVKPNDQYFNEQRTQGERQMQYVFDSTAIIANQRFAASMSSFMTPVNQTWHGLELFSATGDAPSGKAVDEWLEKTRDILFKLRYRVGSGFQSAADSCYASVGAFGNALMFVDFEPGRGPLYRAIPLYECYWLPNNYGRIDLLHRKFKMTSRQLVGQFGDACPDYVKKENEKGGMVEFTVIHSVHPNDKYIPGSENPKHFKFASCYLVIGSGKRSDKVSEGYYRRFPYGVMRFDLSAREDYGRSPAMMALADIQTLNQMSMASLDALKMATTPPWLATEDTATIGVQAFPGAVNYGGIDPTTGRKNIEPMLTGVDVGAGFVAEDRRREMVNAAFMVDLFQILVDRPNMTATEVLQRAQEKGILLSPFYSRAQAEFFGPVIEREIDIAYEMGLIPDEPAEFESAKAEISVVYESPLAKAIRAEEGIAILNFLQGIGVLSQFDPAASKLPNGIRMGISLAEVYGVNKTDIRSEEEISEMVAEEQESMQVQQLLQAAPAAASAANQLAQAQQTATFAPEPFIGG